MELLEQKFNTDIPDIKYTKNELLEHDAFMEKFVFPLDSGKRTQSRLSLFFSNYDNLSENIKINLKELYLEFRIIYFKDRINNIIINDSYKNDSENLNKYINELNGLIGNNETNEYLNSVKKD